MNLEFRFSNGFGAAIVSTLLAANAVIANVHAPHAEAWIVTPSVGLELTGSVFDDSGMIGSWQIRRQDGSVALDDVLSAIKSTLPGSDSIAHVEIRPYDLTLEQRWSFVLLVTAKMEGFSKPFLIAFDNSMKPAYSIALQGILNGALDR